MLTFTITVCSIVVPPLGAMPFVFIAITWAFKLRFLFHLGQMPLSASRVLCGPAQPHWWMTPLLDRIARRRDRPNPTHRFSIAYAIWVRGLAAVLYVCPATVIAGAAFDAVVDNNERAAQDHCLERVEAIERELAQRAARERPGRDLDVRVLYQSCLPNERDPAANDRPRLAHAGVLAEPLARWPSLVEILDTVAPWMPPPHAGGYRFRVGDDGDAYGCTLEHADDADASRRT